MILPDDVTYKIDKVTGAGYLGEELAKIKGQTEYTVTGLITNEGEQYYRHWAITATTAAC